MHDTQYIIILLTLYIATAPAITSHDLTEVECLKIGEYNHNTSFKNMHIFIYFCTATAQVSPSCDPSPEVQCLNSGEKNYININQF